MIVAHTSITALTEAQAAHVEATLKAEQRKLDKAAAAKAEAIVQIEKRKADKAAVAAGGGPGAQGAQAIEACEFCELQRVIRFWGGRDAEMGYTRDTMFFFIRKQLYPLSPPRPQEPGPATAAARSAAAAQQQQNAP